MINIITGDIDSGKTSYLKDLYEQERRGDGILSLKHYEKGVFLGYDVVHLKTGEKRAFIRMKSNLPEEWDGELEIGKYSVSQQGLDFAKELLNNIEKGPIYIDEIGPIELWQKKGFYKEVKKLINKELDLFLTLRPALIDDFHDEFGLKGKTKIITLK